MQKPFNRGRVGDDAGALVVAGDVVAGVVRAYVFTVSDAGELTASWRGTRICD
jgi:hypothetical protein